MPQQKIDRADDKYAHLVFVFCCLLHINHSVKDVISQKSRRDKMDDVGRRVLYSADGDVANNDVHCDNRSRRLKATLKPGFHYPS